MYLPSLALNLMSLLNTVPFTYSMLASLVAQMVKCLPAMRENWVQSLGREDPLEKEMATHSSTLVWKIPWMEELGRPQSMGSQRVGHDWATSLSYLFNVPVLVLITFFFLAPEPLALQYCPWVSPRTESRHSSKKVFGQWLMTTVITLQRVPWGVRLKSLSQECAWNRTLSWLLCFFV